MDVKLASQPHPDTRVLVTTAVPAAGTPAMALVQQLAADPDTYMSRASTYDNPNLPLPFLDALQKRYPGTRLGQQELEGKLLEETP